MEQQILSTIATDLEAYQGPYYHPDDFTQDRVTYLALSYSARTLAGHRREVARRYDEIRRLIRLGIPRHLQENAEEALQVSLGEWSDYIDVHRREQARAHVRRFDRSLLGQLLDVLDNGSLRFKCGHRARRNLLCFMDGSLQTIPEYPDSD